MVPADFKIPFFDSPLGLIIVLLAIVAGFYLFVGNKTPLDYHRQGRQLHEKEEKMQQGNSKEAERNGERGEKIEQVSAGEREDERKERRAKRRRRVDVEHTKAPYGSSIYRRRPTNA